MEWTDRSGKKLPWYLIGRSGWPIERVAGKNNFWRIVFQNIRKVIG